MSTVLLIAQLHSSYNQRSDELTAAGLAIAVENIAARASTDVGLRRADTVMLTAMIPQFTVIYSWGGKGLDTHRLA